MSRLRKIVFSYNQICKVITCQICNLVEIQDLYEWSLDTQNDSFDCSSQAPGALCLSDCGWDVI